MSEERNPGLGGTETGEADGGESSMSETLPVADVEGMAGNAEGNGLIEDDGWDGMFSQINENDYIAPEVPGVHYVFKDIEVKFPYTAYLSQLQMMEKIIEGVTTGENCLLESPTGTGKTAALLCSLLAWQRDCYARNYVCGDVIDKKVERMGGCTCGFIKDEELTEVTISNVYGAPVLQAITYEKVSVPPPSPCIDSHVTVPTVPPDKSCASPSNSVTSLASTTPEPSSTCSTPKKSTIESPSVFESPLKKLKLRERENQPAASPSKPAMDSKEILSIENRHLENLCGYCVRKYVRDRARPPRIYYCTRTHSQIAQVVKQLKSTAYNDAKMTILASREPSCISDLKVKEELFRQQMNTQEQKEEPKLTINDMCRQSRKNYFKMKRLEEQEREIPEDIKETVCKYFRPKWELKPHFKDIQQRGAWDLDDIKQYGVECGMCPYFGCYALHDEADIIFCSYNYLIDPSLRKFTNIYYSNSVVVFDEAHNIEDICRDSFSLVIDVAAFDHDVRLSVDNLLQKGHGPNDQVSNFTRSKLNKASATFQKWSTWIKERGKRLTIPPYREEFVGDQLSHMINEMGMTSDSIQECLSQIGQGIPKEGENEDDSEEDYYYNSRGQVRPFRVSSTVGDYLKRLLLPLHYMCKEEQEGIGGAKDFKGFLTSKPNPKYKKSKSGNSSQAFIEEFLYDFHIICLNPAIAFRVLRNCTYSVIVASGTLTPLESFSSELGCHFEVQLQADHVIPRKNVCACAVGAGPSGMRLELKKVNQEDEDVQDEIGRIISELCDVVPNGILVFFPSYTLMNKLRDRWNFFPRGSTIFQKIQQKKLIFFEEAKDKQVFKRNMQRFKEEVKGGPTWDGCILFAVFRGKISEGIDFADEQARAVITIGIPYSNAGACGIIAKKTYNDMRNRQQSLTGVKVLSGHEWYATQAFRAMNQGFGRCVRHVKDWGSLIMIDARMGQPRNKAYISGWIKENLSYFDDFTAVKEKLTQFIAKMKRFERIDKRRSQIRISYETQSQTNGSADLETTERINVSFDGSESSLLNTTEESLENEGVVTQAVASNHVIGNDVNDFDLPTQVIPEADREAWVQQRDNVSESSPEYSFHDEIEASMIPDRTSTPISSRPRLNIRNSIQNYELNHSDVERTGSPSYFARSPSPVHPTEDDPTQLPLSVRNVSEFANEWDQAIMRRSELVGTARGTEEEVGQNSQTNQSDIMEVSMPFNDESSEDDNISYHSD